MASAERPIQQQQQQQQQHVLKCPRCHSSNTKFCYYNNYSLSQPRHFCKACKRYWTRGGTLRNVPVGGGCRKNKRSIKRSSFTTVDDYSNPNPSPNPNLDHIPPSNNNLNPLYGLLQQNPKFPRFDTTREHSRYDLLIQPQMNSLGLGFSSSDPGDPIVTHAHNSVSLVSNYPRSLYSDGFASSRNNSDHNTMSSTTIPSSLHQQQTFLRFGPYGDQMEGPKRGTDWNNSLNGQNHNDKIKALESSDPISFLWTITGGGDEEWCDPTSNISIPSLI
ncbi:hypothetical protein SSX86_028322 [Deinandra increscens subsp. villosa]|uniref:Dof zinc finger protein n=1 Tax=Deinandra increscens subsp. villosa TaxID=3103831 RepID=A0AAP0C7H9_9ASTR